MGETNKFKINEVVRFVDDKKDYRIIRYYKSNDGVFKYDVASQDSKIWILGMPEDVLEKK